MINMNRNESYGIRDIYIENDYVRKDNLESQWEDL